MAKRGARGKIRATVVLVGVKSPFLLAEKKSVTVKKAITAKKSSKKKS
jgi:hypothetical protein